MAGKTSWLAALATRVIFVLGLAYVSLWWSYQHFYGVFAVSPDDVGLAPGGGGLGDVFVAVLRLGLWLSIALLALGLLPVFCIAVALYALEHPAARMRERRGPSAASVATAEPDQPPAATTELDREATNTWTSRLASRWESSPLADPSPKATSWGAALLALGLLIGIYFANALFVDHPYAAVVVALVVLVTLVCWRFALSSPVGDLKITTRRPRFAVRWWSARQKWLLHISDLFLVLAVIGVLFIDLPGDAHDVAKTLLTNDGTGAACKVPGIGAPFKRFRLDLLSVHGIPAKIAVPHPPTGLPSQSPFHGIYLGSANGWLIIYEKTTSRVLRIPSSSGASILVDAGLKNCHGVH